MELKLYFINSNKQKSRTRWFHCWNQMVSPRRVNTYPSETPPKIKATITLILKSDYDITKKRKKKLQANITVEHRHKNSKLNASKPNPTTHLKEHRP